MSTLVVTGIGRLVSHDPHLPPDGPVSLVCHDGRIAWVGAGDPPEATGDRRLDADGRCVIPGFVDSHTHLVFAGDRLTEFSARLAGADYSAGGIATTVTATRAADRRTLADTAHRLAAEALAGGTTTLEIKSGYGLTVADERRSLEVAGTVDGAQRTFLGAHVVPSEYAADPDGYVDLVCGPMLDACAPLAEWCDVFCDRGAFDADQARAVLAAGRRHGLRARVHANQLGHGPGALVGVEMGAVAVDHCTYLSDDDIAALADAGTVATLLPTVEFSTGSPPAPARRLLDAGVRLALASDCNPGSSYTTSMAFVVALACQRYRLTPDEAVHAATLGGAAALGLDHVGHLRIGATADLTVLDAPDPSYLAYRPGLPQVHAVVRAGRVVRPPVRADL